MKKNGRSFSFSCLAKWMEKKENGHWAKWKGKEGLAGWCPRRADFSFTFHFIVNEMEWMDGLNGMEEKSGTGPPK